VKLICRNELRSFAENEGIHSFESELFNFFFENQPKRVQNVNIYTAGSAVTTFKKAEERTTVSLPEIPPHTNKSSRLF
jgi:hypothetical protein